MKNTILIFVLFFAACSTFGQTILEYNLNVGDLFTIEQNARQTIVQEMDGVTHKLTNELNGLLEFKVIEELVDAYAIDFTFKDMNLLMNSNIQGELMNVKAREVSEEDVQSKIFNSLLDTPVRLILSKTGNILEVSGGDNLVTKMANASELEDDFTKNMMIKSLEKEFGSEALSNSYKQLTYIYSDVLVNIGDTWQNQYTGKLIAENTWSLNSLDEKNAFISGLSNIKITANEAGTLMSLKGSQTTEILTDAKSGIILKMTVEGQSEGDSTIAQLGDQKIPTTITSKITYQLIKD